MNEKLKEWFASLWVHIRQVFHRFPEAVIFAVLFTVSLIMLKRAEGLLPLSGEEMIGRFAMVMVIGCFLGILRSFVAERQPSFTGKYRLAYWLAGFGLMFCFWFWLLDPFGFQTVSRYAGLLIALVLGCFISLFVFKRQGLISFTESVLYRLVITVIFSQIIVAGWIAILATIDFLFNTALMDELVFEISVIIGGIFAPIYFLRGVPVPDELEQNHEQNAEMMPPAFKVLLFSILMPLSTIYAVVLSAYLLKILFTLNWPQGVVGNMVLWFSIVCCLIFYFAEPRKDANRWVRLYMRVMPKWLLPLLVMLFVAVWLRIDAYGVTENRYFLLAAALWTTVTSAYYAFGRRILAPVAPFMLAVIVLVAVSGPWSSYAVALNSQTNQLTAILDRHQLIQDGRMIQSDGKPFSEQEKEQIRSIFQYLIEYHSLKAVGVLPVTLENTDDSFRKWFGFERYTSTQEWNADGKKSFYHNALNMPVLKLGGYDYLLSYNGYHGEQTKFAGSYKLTYQPDQKKLTISSEVGNVTEVDMAALAAEAHRKFPDLQEWKEQQTMLDHQHDGFSFRFVFNNIQGTTDKNHENVVIDNLEFWVLIQTPKN